MRVRLAARHRADAGDVTSLDLGTGGTAAIPLDAVGDVELVPRLAAIDRQHGRRVNRVLGFPAAGTMPAGVLTAFRDRLEDDGFEVPAGYEIDWGGEVEERNRGVGNLAAAIPFILVLMGAVLVVTLRSFRLTAIVAVVAGCAFGLGLGSLWVLGHPLGFMALIGMMGLVGVAINDSIVVIAAIRADPAARIGDAAAVAEVIAGSSRHVVATTLTTVAGFTPLILSGGGFWPPLAVPIAGGVVGGTLLALLLVPAAVRIAFPGRAKAPARNEDI